MRLFWLLLVGLGGVGCASTGPASTRSLHYVNETLVYSPPPSAAAYEAYLQARLALEAEPPDIAEAREQVQIAIRYAPRDPHLWTTLAMIESEAGAYGEAKVAATRALELSPGYAPAEHVIATIDRGLASTGPADDAAP